MSPIARVLVGVMTIALVGGVALTLAMEDQTWWAAAAAVLALVRLRVLVAQIRAVRAERAAAQDDVSASDR